MPAPPPELPESIILQRFAGIRNTVSPERLTVDELETAINVDIDDVGQMRRRRGFARKATGSWHSLFETGQLRLGVKDGALGLIGNAYAFTSLATVGPQRVSYTMVGDTTYYSSSAAAGKIDAAGVRTAWGSDDLWLSPVVNPTATLGAIRGTWLGAPPLATEIELYSGRIYLANERTLWATELYLYDYVDKTKNFIQFESDITMIVGVDDGLYVGTETGLHFLKGVLSSGMRDTQLTTKPVIRGSACKVPASRVHPAAAQGAVREDIGFMCMSTDGIYAGFAGGEVYNLTKSRTAFPPSVSAAALFREQDGGNAYVVAADSAGGTSTNARIGDYVEAEIRRFQGG